VSEERVESGAVPRARIAERRRFARAAVHGIQASVPAVMDAEILDISMTGALVRCGCEVQLGDRASIRLVLDGEPFVAGVSVSRVVGSATGGAGTTYAGVAFIDQDAQSISVLRRFLRSRR
jgi:hypothetical protein